MYFPLPTPFVLSEGEGGTDDPPPPPHSLLETQKLNHFARYLHKYRPYYTKFPPETLGGGTEKGVGVHP